MAMGGGGGRGGVQSEINITPLVDVVLVLLIIFMVVTPLLEKDISVRVPGQDDARHFYRAAMMLDHLANPIISGINANCRNHRFVHFHFGI